MALSAGSIFHLHHRWILDQKNLRVKEFLRRRFLESRSRPDPPPWRTKRRTTTEASYTQSTRTGFQQIYKYGTSQINLFCEDMGLHSSNIMDRGKFAIHQQGRQACNQNGLQIDSRGDRIDTMGNTKRLFPSRRPSHRYTCCYMRERLSTGPHQPSGDRSETHNQVDPYAKGRRRKSHEDWSICLISSWVHLYRNIS